MRGEDARLEQTLDERRRRAVLPVPLAVSTSSLRRPCDISADRTLMRTISY